MDTMLLWGWQGGGGSGRVMIDFYMKTSIRKLLISPQRYISTPLFVKRQQRTKELNIQATSQGEFILKNRNKASRRKTNKIKW